MSEKLCLTVYHDGACTLCAAEIALYRRARGAKAITFVDAALPDTQAELGPELSREAALARFHVRGLHFVAFACLMLYKAAPALAHDPSSGAAAFVALWRTLPGWRWLGRVVGSWPILPLAELAYRAFLPLWPHIARALSRLRRESP